MHAYVRLCVHGAKVWRYLAPSQCTHGAIKGSKSFLVGLRIYYFLDSLNGPSYLNLYYFLKTFQCGTNIFCMEGHVALRDLPIKWIGPLDHFLIFR